MYLKDIENVMEPVLQVPYELIEADLPTFAGLAVWNLLVLFIISKKVYEFSLKKGRSNNSSMYFSREYYQNGCITK